MPAAPAAQEKLSLSVKILYGLGEIPITINMTVFSLFVLFFYSSVMGLSPTLVGIASAVGLAWDAVIDPYIGYRSDCSKSRLGRRHVFMLVGALTWGVCLWLLLRPPQTLHQSGLFVWLLVSTVLLRLASAVYRIPYLSLGAELSQDYHERTVIVGVRSFFGLCGALAAASFSFVLFFPDSAGSDPKLNYSGYPRMGLAYGALATVMGLAAILGTSRYRVPAPSSGQQGMPGLGVFWSGFLKALRNRDFRSVWLSFSIFFLAVSLNGVLAIHYFTWYVELRSSQSLSQIQACFFVGAVVGVLFWIRLSRHIEKRGLYLLSIAMTGTLMTAATFLLGKGSLFGTGDPVPLYWGNALAGFFGSGMWVIPGSMVADVADADELDTGQRREGIFFGLLNFGEKIAAGIAVLLGGVLLDHFVGLAPGEVQSASAGARIGLLFGCMPALLLLAAALVVASYRLNRQAVNSIQDQLYRHRASEVPGEQEQS